MAAKSFPKLLMRLENFGRNVRFNPTVLLAPATNNDVLACLEHHRGERIRAIGHLHSWSDTAACPGTVLDLRRLNDVRLGIGDDGGVYADIEAGCTVDRALQHLAAHGGYTLPTYGIIGKQTIAGAISTATHGAGRASLSHYVSSMRVAAYDGESGRGRIYEWDRGDELRAARCALGCMGIVLSVRIPVEPDFLIEEEGRWFGGIEEVIAQEPDYPRQQFYLVPWSWNWFAQLRRPLRADAGAARSRTAPLHRLFRRVGVDMMMNGVVRGLAAGLRWPDSVRKFYRSMFPRIARSGVHLIDDSRRVLRMRHDLYRHIEMELFVDADHVVPAAAFVEWVLRCCGGERAALPDALRHENFGRDVEDDIEVLRGSYVHDYLITFRRVLRDDTLISMTGGAAGEARYAISLITYQRDHAPFLRMCRFVASAMATVFGARPHWGKICPLTAGEIAALYPALPKFRAVCASVDSHQTFINEFARRTLGF